MLTVLIAPYANASTLKNGAYAHKKRVDHVWSAVKKTKHYPKLLCLAMDCKEGKVDSHAEQWGFDASVITEWTQLGIIKNGILDSETQEIIMVSYFGDRKPEWGVEAPKKIALAYPMIYPRTSWVESIPGYGLIQEIKWAKHMFSVKVPVAKLGN